MSPETYISTSPERKERKRRELEARDLSLANTLSYKDWQAYEMLVKDDDERLLANKENNLEYDLRTTQWILDKVRSDELYAQNLYAALCNNEFQKNDVLPILQDQRWDCSWRYAGGIIANMREEGDYTDWYLSGMASPVNPDDPYWLESTPSSLAEGTVSDVIKADLLKLNWLVV